jgi:hypothetical protein
VVSRLLAVIAAWMLALSPAAADNGVESQRMSFTENGGTLYVTTSLTRLFDARAYEKLENGLAAVVVIRLWVYPEGKAKQLGFVLLHRRCIYDLWREFYTCALTGPDGRRTYKVKFKTAALTLLTGLDNVPIADVTKGPVVVAAIAELNPVSKETMAEVRRWLSQGSGGGLDRGGSFFGSFVSVFVNLKIPEADRVLRVRSQPYTSPSYE